ncbi:MAG: SHOCT domain-containing protein [Catenulispora sp.]
MRPRPWNGPGHHMHEGLGWGGWVLWALFMAALWALVIVAIVWLVRGLSGRGRGYGPAAAMTGPVTWRGSGTAAAERILAERFAQGQIDEEEYRARLGVLRGEQMSAPYQAPPQPPQPPPAPPPPPPSTA